MLLNFILLLIINLLAVKLAQYTRIWGILMQLKIQLQNCFVLLTKNNQSDQEKEKAAILIGAEGSPS